MNVALISIRMDSFGRNLPHSVNLTAMVRSFSAFEDVRCSHAHDCIGTFARVKGMEDRAHSDKAFIIRDSNGSRDYRVQL